MVKIIIKLFNFKETLSENDDEGERYWTGEDVYLMRIIRKKRLIGNDRLIKP